MKNILSIISSIVNKVVMQSYIYIYIYIYNSDELESVIVFVLVVL